MTFLDLCIAGIDDVHVIRDEYSPNITLRFRKRDKYFEYVFNRVDYLRLVRDPNNFEKEILGRVKRELLDGGNNES